MQDKKYKELNQYFEYWEKIKDLTDQYIDLMLNYRQSGHPGGSRSKVHAFIVNLFSGAMRWDIRDLSKRFADRFVLVGGHCTPLVYGAMAVLYDAMRIKYNQTQDPKYQIKGGEARSIFPEDLITLRNRNGLPGHAEMIEKSLLFKFNTGPSGHGSPAAAGQATALKLAGAEEVKVFAYEGEGGHTAGAIHETKNIAWGLGLSNLYYIFDWNDFGIDSHRVSSVVHGSPRDWFEPYGWRVFAADHGSEWEPVTKMFCDMIYGPNPHELPTCGYMKTRKGRGYLVYDYKSHGAAHKMNSELFWQTKKEFGEKYGVYFEGQDKPAPDNPEALRKQAMTNFKIVSKVLEQDQELIDYITETLTDIGDSVPKNLPNFRLPIDSNPIHDKKLYDYKNYPEDIYAKPGEKKPNRAALAKWGSWVNAYCAQKYHRPLFLAMSADLADSTNISGFAKAYGDFEGYGWYERDSNPDGALLPMEITEFSNSGTTVGIASVNMHTEPEEDFNGFYAACSTYGSFSYLKYGLMRLYSQLAQDCPLKLGKVIWVAGHSGPETAEDSRTHFGVFSPGVTQLFPTGHVINLYPYEYNEVPVLLGEALSKEQPIIVLHLTRPGIIIPDREKHGIASHFEAAKGAYLIRDYEPDKPKMGVVIVSGTSSTDNTIAILDDLNREGINVKIVAAPSYDLYQMQPREYRDKILPFNEWMDSMVITNRARKLMHNWICNKVCEEYSLSSDWDDNWRGGGSVKTVVEDAHLSSEWILKGIKRFAEDREKRLERLKI
ncbi:MAG: transketolase [candidate division Zixibacteria bacterium]|nr:transketolase [candidate division Zixibacteria bacterium]